MGIERENVYINSNPQVFQYFFKVMSCTRLAPYDSPDEKNETKMERRKEKRQKKDSLQFTSCSHQINGEISPVFLQLIFTRHCFIRNKIFIRHCFVRNNDTWFLKLCEFQRPLSYFEQAAAISVLCLFCLPSDQKKLRKNSNFGVVLGICIPRILESQNIRDRSTLRDDEINGFHFVEPEMREKFSHPGSHRNTVWEVRWNGFSLASERLKKSVTQAEKHSGPHYEPYLLFSQS